MPVPPRIQGFEPTVSQPRRCPSPKLDRESRGGNGTCELCIVSIGPGRYRQSWRL